MTDTTKTTHEQSPSLGWLFAVLCLVALLWGGAWIAVDDKYQATFGDVFGAVNTLFTGLAFAILIYTVWLQRTELALQRVELKDTRAELKGQKEQLQAQNVTLKRQRFENTFFQLLGVHHEIVNAMHISHPSGKTIVSREAFQEINDQLHRIVQRNVEKTMTSSAVRAYLSLYAEHEHRLGHYFRNLYHIVRYVKDSGLSEDDQYTYVRFVRAQLSSAELALLLCNGLTDRGAKFKLLIEHFTLLKNLAPDPIMSDEREAYDARAFRRPNDT